MINVIIRPFVSRVDPKEQIGLNPVRKLKTHQPVKKSKRDNIIACLRQI